MTEALGRGRAARCIPRASVTTSLHHHSGQRRPVSALSLSPNQERGRVVRLKGSNLVSRSSDGGTLCALYPSDASGGGSKSFWTWDLLFILPWPSESSFIPGRKHGKETGHELGTGGTSMSFAPILDEPFIFHTSCPFYFF